MLCLETNTKHKDDLKTALKRRQKKILHLESLFA